MKTLHVVLTALALSLMVIGSQAYAAELDSQKKMEMEQKLVGDWKVPKNKYKRTITFSMANDRTFRCTYQQLRKDPVEYSGNWRVRTASDGMVNAYFKARNESDPESFMKAVLRTDHEMEKFMIDIDFDFKSSDAWTWHSYLVKEGAGGDDAMGDDEDMEDEEDWGDDEDDEDWGDEEDDEDWGDDEDWEDE